MSIEPGAKRYVASVFRIETFTEDGVPETCTLIPQDTVIELNPEDPSKNQFMVCLVPENMLRPRDQKDV